MYIKPQVAIKILSNLTATELCLAGCVISPWSDMTEDDILWFNLVKSEWKYAKYVQDRILVRSNLFISYNLINSLMLL